MSTEAAPLPAPADLAPCPGCGVLFPVSDGPTHRYIGASPGCWAQFGEVLAREYGDPAYFASHFLTVDAYAAQHPGNPSRETIQSVAVHLVRLHLILEAGLSAGGALAGMRRTLAHQEQFVWLDPPLPPWPVTVTDVFQAQDADDHKRLVSAWAEAVWTAWTPHHAMIHRWAAL